MFGKEDFFILGAFALLVLASYIYDTTNPIECVQENTVVEIMSAKGRKVVILLDNNNLLEIDQPSTKIQAGSVICTKKERVKLS